MIITACMKATMEYAGCLKQIFFNQKIVQPHVFSQLWGWCHEEGGKNALNYIGKHNIDLYGQTQQFFSINLLFNLVFF